MESADNTSNSTGQTTDESSDSMEETISRFEHNEVINSIQVSHTEVVTHEYVWMITGRDQPSSEVATTEDVEEGNIGCVGMTITQVRIRRDRARQEERNEFTNRSGGVVIPSDDEGSSVDREQSIQTIS